MATVTEEPAVSPNLLRIGATLSVIGAVVGEFVGSDKGLGFLINVGRGQFDTALVFVAIFTLIFMALSLYGLAMLADGERVRVYQWLALLLATAGIVVIAGHTGGDITLAGLLMVLCAALAWAGGNQVARRMGRVDMLGVVVWSSAFALPPLLLLSLLFEGPARIAQALVAAGPAEWAAVAWQAAGNTLFGYSAWGWLLSRHPAATVAPMALLVPVFGMGASAALLGESLPAWKLLAAALVMTGLALNLFGSRWRGIGS